MFADLFEPRVLLSNFSRQFGGFSLLLLAFGFDLSQLLGQGAPILHPDGGPQVLQSVRIFFVASGFGRLSLDTTVAIPDLVHDIGQTNQIAIDASQSPLSFDFVRLEATDAGSFLEDRPPFFGTGLQHPLDLALLDQTVGVRPDSCPAKE